MRSSSRSRRRLRAKRWQMTACSVALVAFEAVSLYGDRVAQAHLERDRVPVLRRFVAGEQHRDALPRDLAEDFTRMVTDLSRGQAVIGPAGDRV